MSSSSNESNLVDTSISSSNNKNNNKKYTNNKSTFSHQSQGELFLLYRHLKDHKMYHLYNTKNGGANRKKGLKIPQDYPGENLFYVNIDF